MFASIHRDLPVGLALHQPKAEQRSGLPNWRDGKLKFDFAPGERNQYSGEGFEWLRRALEKGTGEKMEALATRLVFEPAGMKSTTYMWSAWVWLVPGQKRGLVVLSNGSAGSPLLPGALNATLNARGDFPRLQLFTEARAHD